jgi:AraC-like DNA-binding protein
MTITLRDGRGFRKGVRCHFMSLTRHGDPRSVDGVAAIAASFQMIPETGFEWHSHSDHQLAWAAGGVLIILIDTWSYVLPPTRALWIPAATPHEARATTAATMRSLYLRPARCPLDWPEPRPVSVSPLLAELISHLGDERVGGPARARAEALVYDLLVPIRTAAIELPLPRDDRANQVAAALLASPRGRRTLAEWGREVGASDRTLARIFVEETGLAFGRWRTRARLQAALELLAEGVSVKAVAPAVGYETTSAFVAAFRGQTGVSPGKYFRDAGATGAAPAKRRLPAPARQPE